MLKALARGELEQGEILPTVRQMAADLGVNAMTVSKAYQLLKAEGFIETDRRKGSIVCIPEKEYPTQQAAFEEKLEDELELLHCGSQNPAGWIGTVYTVLPAIF